MTIAAPPAARFSITPACRARSAMCCRYSSMVSSMLDPEVGGRSKRLKAGRRASGGTGIGPPLPATAARGGGARDRARLAANLRIVGVLEAAEPVVVDPDPAEQVRRQLLVRIEA